MTTTLRARPRHGKKLNKHGLQRKPSAAVRREIRRRCGFGCVICGSAIITYEHFSPEYKDAMYHNPKGMTLLCGTHQLETSKGLLSKKTIAEADRDPFCKKTGYAKHLLDLGGKKPTLLIGGVDATECGPKIEIDGETLLQIYPPDLRSNRWRLSCRFKDQDGTIMCEIVENELVISSESIDIEQQATRFSIKSVNETFLELELQAPDALFLKKYCVLTKNGRIVIGPEKVVDILHPASPPKSKTMLRFETGAGATTFIACQFVAPTGLIIRFVNGGIQFGSA